MTRSFSSGTKVLFTYDKEDGQVSMGRRSSRISFGFPFAFVRACALFREGFDRSRDSEKNVVVLAKASIPCCPHNH